ncbi:MAG: hypothetical protein U9N61_01835, partial [Euryarchaeota archaeon]|nr:hypothetical protein [Euryarchaeota archaeon]
MEQEQITRNQYFDIYDRNKTHEQISLDITEIEQLFSHEDKKERLTRLEDKRPWTLVKNTINRYIPIAKALVSSGTYSIGAGLDYDTVTLFEADIAAQLTGNLTGEHADEETSITSAITFDTDTNSYLLKLTAASGAEHNGTAYGNGARINFSHNDSIIFDETNDGDLDDVEISKLALDIRDSLIGVRFNDGGNSGLLKVNRLLFKGNADTLLGCFVNSEGANTRITNSIFYDIGNVAGEGAIRYRDPTSGHNHLIANNTIINCYEGITQDDDTTNATDIVKNNLIQNSSNKDFRDDGGGFGTTSKNISEDATSPDAAYQSKEVIFVDEANDDYHLASTDIQAKDAGEDLSATFTDDIDGNTRAAGTDWDIGADERTSTAIRS